MFHPNIIIFHKPKIEHGIVYIMLLYGNVPATQVCRNSITSPDYTCSLSFLIYLRNKDTHENIIFA